MSAGALIESIELPAGTVSVTVAIVEVTPPRPNQPVDS